MWGKSLRRFRMYSNDKNIMLEGALPKPASRASHYGEKDVWGIFTPLAVQHNSINLGQGFPNFPAPEFVKEAACKAINGNLNQYAPSKGLPRLRNALSNTFKDTFIKGPLDPEKEIMITQGANQGIAVALQAFINSGDEVILIEPYFDIYKPSIEIVGGKVVTIPLRLTKPFTGVISSNEWALDFKELESKVTPKTKAILFNNPHNPTGKLFSSQELSTLAEIAVKNNLLVLSDDVYDQLYYEGEMLRIANFPGMWDRTITFGSGGKTFGVTGWRIGWIFAPQHLLKYILAVHARTVFTTPTPLQEAVAIGFERAAELNYFENSRNDYKRRRDKAVQIFKDLNLPVAIPHGSYFFMVETSKISKKLPETISEELNDNVTLETRDYSLCRWLTTEFGVTAIPPSAFYQTENKYLAENHIRICFAKSDESLEEARKRLKGIERYIIKG